MATLSRVVPCFLPTPLGTISFYAFFGNQVLHFVHAYQGSSDYSLILGTSALEVCFDLALSPRIMVNHQGGTVEMRAPQEASCSLHTLTLLQI